MKAELLKFQGLWLKVWRPTIETKTTVACIGGSGEYYLKEDAATLNKLADKSNISYGYWASKGKEYPLNIVVPLAPKGKSQADHSPIMAYLAEYLISIGAFKPGLLGLSQGGQTAMGFATGQAKYKGGEIFGGFVIMSGKTPGTPNYCARPEAKLLVVHAVGDTAIPIASGDKIVREWNKCPDHKSSPARIIRIPGGGHSTSWTKGYNITDPVGKQVYDFVTGI